MSDTTTIPTTPPDPAALIDRAAIERADADLAAIQLADREARAALMAAEAALVQANRDADTAAEGAASIAAEAAVRDAELVLRAAQRRAGRTASAAAAAPREHRAAVGQAHRHAIFATLEARLDACRRTEVALAEIAAAKTAFDAATKAMLAFANAGCQLAGAMDAPREVLAVAAEARYWHAKQVDVAGRRFYPGERVGETA